MTTAEKYRQLEKSPSINIARYIFNCIKTISTNSTLGDEIIEIKTGKTPSKQNKRFYEDDFLSWFKPDEIGSEKYLFDAKDKLSKFAFENNQATIYEPDTILINAIGDVGRVSILKVKASSNQQITGIRLNEKIDVDYAYFYLLANRHFFYVDLFQTTLPIVNQKKINSIPFAYPSKNEQRNIVEGLVEIDKIKSVDDIGIIDKLNWNEEYKNACRNFFNVQFNSKDISIELTHQLDLVKKLRQQLLQDAVQGKLVEQNQSRKLSGEPASELLKKIKAEKQKLIAEKKLKKEKELPPIKPEEIPFKIPENWVWCKIGDITTSIVPNRDKPLSFTGDINWITQANFSDDDYKLNYNLTGIGLSREEVKKYNCRVMPIGSVIMSCVGQFDLVCLVEKEIVANQQLHCFIPHGNLQPMYLCYSVKYFSKLIEKEAIQTTIKYINKTKCESILIPLPPLSEQKRIVQKLDELMQYCNDLEASIKQSQQQNEKLLQQVLREALRKESVGA